MAVLNRPLLLNQQRFDLEDWKNLLESLLKDAQRFTTGIISADPCVVGGFYPEESGGTYSLHLTNASLIFPKNVDPDDPDDPSKENDNVYSWFVVPADNTIDARLQSGTGGNNQGLLVAELENIESNPVNKLLYDPSLKKSFTKTVNSTKSVQLKILEKIIGNPLEEGQISLCEFVFENHALKRLVDRREMLFRRQRTAKATVADASTFKVGGGYTWANHTAGNDFYVHEIDLNLDTLSITFAAHPNFTNDASFVKFIEDFESKPLNLRNILTDLQEKIRDVKGVPLYNNNAPASVHGVLQQLNSKLVGVGSNPQITYTAGGGVKFSKDDVLNTGSICAHLDLFGPKSDIYLSVAEQAIGEDEVLYIDLSGKYTMDNNVDYTVDNTVDNTVSPSDYLVADKNDFKISENNYWIAHRSGNKLYLRDGTVLLPSESTDIGQDDLDDSFWTNILGVSKPESGGNIRPNFTPDIGTGEDFYGSVNDNLVERLKRLTASASRQNMLNGAFFSCANPLVFKDGNIRIDGKIKLNVSWTRNTEPLRFPLEIDLSAFLAKDDKGNDQLYLADKQAIFVEINEYGAITVDKGNLSNKELGKNIFALFARIDSKGTNNPSERYLHIPLHKQIIPDGEQFFIGSTSLGLSGKQIALQEEVKRKLWLSGYKNAGLVVAEAEKSGALATGSTATYSPVAKAWRLTTSLNKLVTNNLLALKDGEKLPQKCTVLLRCKTDPGPTSNLTIKLRKYADSPAGRYVDVPILRIEDSDYFASSIESLLNWGFSPSDTEALKEEEYKNNDVGVTTTSDNINYFSANGTRIQKIRIDNIDGSLTSDKNVFLLRKLQFSTGAYSSPNFTITIHKKADASDVAVGEATSITYLNNTTTVYFATPVLLYSENRYYVKIVSKNRVLVRVRQSKIGFKFIGVFPQLQLDITSQSAFYLDGIAIFYGLGDKPSFAESELQNLEKVRGDILKAKSQLDGVDTKVAKATSDIAKYVTDEKAKLKGDKGDTGPQGVTGPSGGIDLTELAKKADKITTKKFFTDNTYDNLVIKSDTDGILKIFNKDDPQKIVLPDISDYYGATKYALKDITNSDGLDNSTNSENALENSTNSSEALHYSTNSGNALYNSTNSNEALWNSKNSGQTLESSTNSGNALYNSVNSNEALYYSTNSDQALEYSKNYGDVLVGSYNSGLALANSTFTNWNLTQIVGDILYFYMTSAKNMTFINGIFTAQSFSCPKTIPDGEVYGNNLTASGGNTENLLFQESAWAGTTFTNWFYTGDILADGSPRTDGLGPTKTAGPDLSGIPASVRAQIRPISEMGKLALGAKGADGKQGPQGIQGVGGIGLAGQDGAPGLTGPKGQDGDKGDRGANGAKGDKGDTGVRGLQGIQGLTGKTGPIGATGADGDQGPVGATGTQGPTGARGQKGDKGDKGEAGDLTKADADTYYAPFGSVGGGGGPGTKGDPGDKGDKGDDGPQGTQGPTGAQGKQGDRGPIGPQGLAGADGQDGQAGSDGAEGIRGIRGLQGFKGNIGATGAAGADGTNGVKGDPGQDGTDGINGVKGDPGVKGDKGDPGQKGDKGEVGTASDMWTKELVHTGAITGVSDDIRFFSLKPGKKYLCIYDYEKKSTRNESDVRFGFFDSTDVTVYIEKRHFKVYSSRYEDMHNTITFEFEVPDSLDTSRHFFGYEVISAPNTLTKADITLIELSGTKGDKGDAGVSNTPGPKGDKGNPGAAGTPGLKGDKGADGAGGLTQTTADGRYIPKTYLNRMEFSEDNTYGASDSGTGVVNGHYRYGAGFLTNSDGVGLLNYYIKPKRGNFKIVISSSGLTSVAVPVYDANGVLQFIDIPENVAGVSIPSNITVAIVLSGLEDILNSKADKASTREWLIITQENQAQYASINDLWDPNGVSARQQEEIDHGMTTLQELRHRGRLGALKVTLPPNILINDHVNLFEGETINIGQSELFTNAILKRGAFLRVGTLSGGYVFHGLTMSGGTLIHLGNLSGGQLLTQGTMSGGYVLYVGTMSGGQLLNQGTMSGGDILHQGTLSGGYLLHQGTLSGGDILHQGTMSGGALLSDGNMSGGNLLHSGTMSGGYLLDRGGKIRNVKIGGGTGLARPYTKILGGVIGSPNDKALFDFVIFDKKFGCPAYYIDEQITLSSSNVETYREYLQDVLGLNSFSIANGVSGSWTFNYFKEVKQGDADFASATKNESEWYIEANNCFYEDGAILSGIPADVRAKIRPIAEMGLPPTVPKEKYAIKKIIATVSSMIIIEDDRNVSYINIPNFEMYNLKVGGTYKVEVVLSSLDYSFNNKFAVYSGNRVVSVSEPNTSVNSFSFSAEFKVQSGEGTMSIKFKGYNDLRFENSFSYVKLTEIINREETTDWAIPAAGFADLPLPSKK